jgi:hypothetical protein
LEKYSRLADAIHFELLDKNASTIDKLEQSKIELVSSEGIPFTREQGAWSDEKGLSAQASAFFAGLNWLAFRSIYFSLVATKLQTDLILHPIRHAFHLSWLSKLKGQDPSWYRPVINSMSDIANTTLQEIQSVTQPAFVATEVPIFCAWLVNKVGSPKNIIQAAFDLRNDKRLQAARRAFIDLDQISQTSSSDYVKTANKIVKNLRQALDSVKADFSVGTSQGNALNSIIKVANFGLQLTPWQIPSVPLDLIKSKAADAFSQKLQDRYVSPLYRSVVNDLASISRLGEIHEKLCASVVLKRDANKYLSKTEQIEFYKKSSHWKRPM